MRPVTLSRVVHCNASRERVWRHVSNTLRLNRAIGTSTLTVTANDTRTTERFQMRCRMGGFRVTYLESPFSWEEGRFFSFHRSMLDGPALTVATRYDLSEPEDGAGCDVTVRIDVTPRWGLLRPLIWLATRSSMSGLARFIASVDGAPEVVATPVDSGSLEAARARIRSTHDPSLVARLVSHLQLADDLALSPIRPFSLARAWEVDRTALLRLCLEAVPAGLLELRWGLLCPSCRTASQVIPHLRDLDSKAHCHACDLSYDTDLDRAVEAQFFPHPSVRRIDARPFCIAGPALTPHVFAQMPLEQGTEGTLAVPSEVGAMRLFMRGGATSSLEVAESGAESVDVTMRPGDVAPHRLTVAPSGAIHVINESGEGRHVKIERTGWLTDAATAHHVATMPEFRPLFGAEALRPGLALRISHVAILFSDLCGSTALYSRVGDAAAFGVVTDCLAYGVEIVERHGGTLVKTIGDAVMAAFTDSRGAVAAGVEMLERWSAFVGQHPGASALDLKVGVFEGPCTIVTANGTIDYFGQTVNSAARVQHLAGPREAMLAEALVDRVPAGAAVDLVERFEARVKGIDAPIKVARMRARSGQAAGTRGSG